MIPYVPAFVPVGLRHVKVNVLPALTDPVSVLPVGVQDPEVESGLVIVIALGDVRVATAVPSFLTTILIALAVQIDCVPSMLRTTPVFAVKIPVI